MMLKNITLTKQNFLITLLITLSGIFTSKAQLYQHNFGTTSINSHPYTVAPTVSDPSISNSSWTNNTNAWVSYVGASGQALGLANSSGAASVTLTFTVAAGKQMTVDSFSFWRQRSNNGAPNWTMAINGINVGSGTTPTSGASTGVLPVTNPVSNLTGTINVTLSLNGAAGAGTFRIDDFTLIGTITNACTSPVISTISPSSGPVNTIVTLNGSGFQAGTGTSAVKFNGIDAQSFTVVSDTEITATVPAAATSGAITVTTNGCPGTAATFTVTSAACNIAPPSDIYISELYDQQSGSGGMIEIYNPTSTTINLSNYTLERYGDITDPPPPDYSLILSGTLAPEAIYLVACTTPNQSICATPTASQILGAGFNGGDKFQLLKNGVLIDRIDVPFTAPGYTLIRKSDAVAPKTVYSVTDWNNTQHPADNSNPLPNNFCNDLGNHNALPATGGTTPAITHPVAQNGCENASTTFNVTISDPTGFTYQWKVLTPNGTWTNITNGGNYAGATTAALTINNLPASFSKNQYYCEMTSGSTCTVISNTAQLIVNPSPAEAVTSVTQPTCTTATGTITITSPTGAGFTYSIDGTTYQAATAFTNLTSGSYTVTVKNAANCTSSVTVVINAAPAAPAIATTTVEQPTCTIATGTITINSPLAADITYSIDGITFQAGAAFDNLQPGDYNVTTKNAAGCTSVTNTITINPVPGAPAVADVTTTQPSCAVISTGSITVNSPTGTGLTYSIDGTTFQTETSFTNLPAGSYTVTVKNAAGCTSVTNAITINAATAPPAIAEVTVSQPTCTTATGSIEVTSPLIAGLEYSLDGATFQTAPLFSNLQPGQYIVTVRNTQGCTSVTNTITINAVPTAPAIADVTITQPTCAAPTGTITVTSPVSTDLTYSIDGATFQADTTFANLQQGTYTITVKNSAGCESVSNIITVNAVPGAPAVADITITQPTCAIPTGTITVNSPTGTGLTYSIDGVNFQPTALFGNLQPGSYVITVKNAEGCTSVTNPVTINPITGVPASAAVSVLQPTCAVQTGNLSVSSPTGNDLTYSIDGTNFQAGTTFANLQPGSYNITVRNAEGCTSVTNGFVINPVPALPSITTTQGCRNTAFGQNYILEAAPLDNSFDIATASFKWTDNQGAVIGNDENTFDVTRYVADNAIDANDFPITITVLVINAQGCESSAAFTIDSYFCNIPRGISPNNDGMNDSFNLTGMNVKTLKIFNRYGAEVYAANNYKNEWHGQSDNGNELPTGTYYYTIEVSGQDTQTGWVYINREEK